MYFKLSVFFCLITIQTIAQSVHEEQLNYYNNLGIEASEYENINTAQPKPVVDRSNCTLNKVVYGWHPYWSNGLQTNYDWDLLSHLCYFSYEVDANTGNAISTHNFSTAQAVTTALANNVRVDLCVTLFSNHTTFLNNGTAQQTLITNLINLISARGAHGVNIDFEGIPSSQKINFRNFMNNLSNQMHAAIPGSQVSTVLYAVDWNDVFDVAAMSPVDYFIIMGYDYYWSGSTNTGPNDPLFHFSSTYNYTLSKSVTYYLNKGVPANKLVLGLPYYGREWPTTSAAVPGTTSGSGTARTYTYVKNNSSGYYSAANRNSDQASQSTYYVFNNVGWRQCFITEENNLRERLDFINKRGIAGMGIWALGYDDGYNQFWNAIESYFTECEITPCNDSIYDIGGGYLKNYYDNENYTYTISPPNASSINVHFISFSLENNYDFLYVYDGPNTSSPQVPGSPFTGNSIPADIGSSGGSLTFRFTSDGSTVSTGFLATYTCVEDLIPPSSSLTGTNNWKTANFPMTFTDSDQGSGIENRFWQVLDHNGTEWRANANEGFFNDNFQNSIHSDWTNVTGTWIINTQHLEQNDQSQSNTNIYSSLTQNNSYTYLYHWQAMMAGTAGNRRSGLHFFVDNPALPNRGNSYFVYYRVDNNKCQIYKVNNDVFTLMTDHSCVINPSVWYDFKVIYNPSTGKISAYLNNTLVSSWTDSSPIQNGNFISLRSGNTLVQYDDVKVYRSRTSSENINIGSSSSMVRYQNSAPGNPACRINSLSKDYANNWSVIASRNENIDWTQPISGNYLYDGLANDIDTSGNNTSFPLNWDAATDLHSDILHYEVAIGTAPGLQDVAPFTNVGNVTSTSITGIFLNYGETYYGSLKSVNYAGLSSVINSNGVYITSPTNLPTATIHNTDNEICVNDSIQMINTSINATSFSWTFPGGSPSVSSHPNPKVFYPSTGNYLVSLVATGPGGTDSTSENITVTFYEAPIADFTVNNDTLFLPNAFLAISNTSQFSNSAQWSFGDGDFSSDINPWHVYDSVGIYTLELIAGNIYCNSDTIQQTIVVMHPVGMEEVKNESWNLFPNPNNGAFIIQNFSFELAGYELYDVSGKLILSGVLQPNSQFEIQTQVKSGLYLLHVEIGDIKTTKKIIITT